MGWNPGMDAGYGCTRLGRVRKGHDDQRSLGLGIDDDLAFVIHFALEPMGPMEKMGLTGGRARGQGRGSSVVIGTALVTTASGMAVFWIWHGLRKIDLLELFPTGVHRGFVGRGGGGVRLFVGIKAGRSLAK